MSCGHGHDAQIIPPFEKTLAQHYQSALEGRIERITTLFDAIKHGDEKHQQWLKEAIEAHFEGQPVPEAR
jgi:hypothetical protein